MNNENDITHGDESQRHEKVTHMRSSYPKNKQSGWHCHYRQTVIDADTGYMTIPDAEKYFDALIKQSLS
jgi:hypothetical protein